MDAARWGRRVRAFRKLKGYTQGTFAKKLGISVSIVGEIERGVRLPSVELVQKMAIVLQITIDELKPPVSGDQ